MPIDRRALIALLLAPALGACQTTVGDLNAPDAAKFGEANRQTLAAQVVDPDPQYEYLDPPTSGQHASAASAAVSARRMRGPRPTAVTKSSLCNASSSSRWKPPSGPTSTAQGAALALASSSRNACPTGAPPPLSSASNSRRPCGQSRRSASNVTAS